MMAQAATPDKLPPTALEFLDKKYALDREHELELNKFTHVFEVERLKLLLLLNGGAAGLWLGFLKTGGEHAATVSLQQAVPVFLWVFGTLLAAGAFHYALKTQRDFTRAYHNRRRAFEWRFLSEQFAREDIVLLISDPQLSEEIDGQSYDREEAHYAATAKICRKHAENAGEATKWTAGASVFAFAIGTIVAAMGML
jgi:hypothetical protein